MRYKPRRKTSGFRQADLILLHSSSCPTSQLQSEDRIARTTDRGGQPRTHHSFFSVLPDIANIFPSPMNTEPSCKHCVSLFHTVALTSSSQGCPCTAHCWRGSQSGGEAVLGATEHMCAAALPGCCENQYEVWKRGGRWVLASRDI